MLVEFYPSVVLIHPYLQNIAVDVFTFCSKCNIPREQNEISEQNELADYYSRIKDTDNWSIDNDSFSRSGLKWVPF